MNCVLIGKINFIEILMVKNGFQAPTFSIFKIIFLQTSPNLITGGSISQGKSHFGIICIKKLLGCLTHELSEEKSAKFDRVDHLWPHKVGD